MLIEKSENLCASGTACFQRCSALVRVCRLYIELLQVCDGLESKSPQEPCHRYPSEGS